MIALVANDIDLETRLKKYPFLTPDEVPDILAKLDMESASRLESEESTDENIRGQGVE
jgi:hypothetical protein